MNKFLKIEASTTGTVLIGLDNIGLVAKASNTTVTISYASGNAAVDVMTITHTSDTTLATVQAIIDAIVKAGRPDNAPDQFVVPVLPTGITVSTVVVA
jgi:hypothetical protein